MFAQQVELHEPSGEERAGGAGFPDEDETDPLAPMRGIFLGALLGIGCMAGTGALLWWLVH